jgi:hypothetical protein
MKTLKSIGAILLGIIVVFALSHFTDWLLESNGMMIIPFDENPIGLKLFVTFYRNLYVAIGCYVAVAFAPDKPFKHIIIFASIGAFLGILGAVAMWNIPPHWYPIALIVLGIPSAWIGGWLRVRKSSTAA